MFPQKFLNSRSLFTFGRANTKTKFFFSDMTRMYSTKDKDSTNTKEKPDKEKIDKKSRNSLKIQINGDEEADSFSKFHKIHGNMAGMDKIDGMAGQTAGISSSHGKTDRPEEGIYIYSGKLLDKESEKNDKQKKSDQKK